nr:hypothetical protein [Tanacetum cinerariifolium]
VAGGDETARDEDFDLRELSVLQQPSCFGDAQLQVITLRRGAQLFFEQALDLPARAPCVNRQLVHLQRFLKPLQQVLQRLFRLPAVQGNAAGEVMPSLASRR